MKAKSMLIPIIFVLVISTNTFSQQPNQDVNVAPNAPKDKPVDAKAGEVQKFEEAIKLRKLTLKQRSVFLKVCRQNTRSL